METTPPHLAAKPLNGQAPDTTAQMQAAYVPGRLPHLALLKWINPLTFAPLSESDDRLMVLTEFFRASLLSKPATATGHPEIEARMGRYSLNEKLSAEETALGNIMLSMGYLQVLPFKQEGQKPIKNLFRFTSGIREDHFHFLKGLFDDTSSTHGSGVKNRGKSVLADKIYSNGVRETTDTATGNVTEVIEKTNRNDINLHNRGQDIRITSSIEQKQKPTATKGATVKYTRTKTRYSYDYEYMGFDLTHVKVSNEAKPTYEVELEVRDVGFLVKHTNDIQAFTKLVLRFVSNLQSLYHILSQKYPENFGGIIESHYKGVYGESAPAPVVGGYLGCVAYRKTLQEKEEKGNKEPAVVAEEHKA